MSDQRMRILLVGIGGYGNSYVNMLLDAPEQDRFVIVGAVDPYPESCRRFAELQSRNVPVMPSLEDFYDSERSADLAIISTPPQLHAAHTELAMSRGSHVLCEKPLCTSPGDAVRMAEAQSRWNKHVAIGYQWSFSRSIEQLKSQILAGDFGRPIRLRTLVLWPRDESYYARNRWAGTIKDARGQWVLDSPANNACAHYLHNMLYVLGDRPDRSITPATLTAELYRAHRIENYDTAVLRCRTTDDIDIHFVVSHATVERRGPVFHYEFERATITFDEQPGASILANTANGLRICGSPNEDRARKFWHTLDCIQGHASPLCGIEAATPHTQCVWAAQRSMPLIADFPHSSIRVTGPIGKQSTTVAGLGDALRQCYDQWKLPSELGFEWARQGETVSLPAHGAFPSLVSLHRSML